MELTPEQLADRKERLSQASLLLSTRVKDMLIEVEDTYQFKFTFGLEYTPFAVTPAFIPTDTKNYNVPTE